MGGCCHRPVVSPWHSLCWPRLFPSPWCQTLGSLPWAAGAACAPWQCSVVPASSRLGAPAPLGIRDSGMGTMPPASCIPTGALSKQKGSKRKQAVVFSPLASSRQSLGTGARLPELVIHCAHGVFISSQCCAVGIQQKYDTFNWERNGRPQATTATGFIIVAGTQHIDSATI